MHALAPCSLDPDALTNGLRALVGDERAVQVKFLLYLDEFDRRQEYLPRGFGSLWDFCLHDLHLREGPAGRRIAAMKALRRFPRLESPLRDGRLCISTAPLLAQVLTDENLEALVARAAFKTKAEVEHLVATIQPRAAPRDGLRRLPEPRAASLALVPASADPAPSDPASGSAGLEVPESVPATAALAQPAAPSPIPAPAHAPAAELRPISRDEWSLRITIDGALKADLETLASLLSHKLRRTDYAALLREAVDSAIEKHGKRRGAVPPSRKRKGKALAAEDVPDRSRLIPAEVKRAVYERDRGCCAFVGKNGRRCGSRWQIEFNHVPALAKGGKSTVEGVQLACRGHNIYDAEQVFGREYMAKYRREWGPGTQTSKFADPGIRDSQCRLQDSASATVRTTGPFGSSAAG